MAPLAARRVERRDVVAPLAGRDFFFEGRSEKGGTSSQVLTVARVERSDVVVPLVEGRCERSDVVAPLAAVLREKHEVTLLFVEARCERSDVAAPLATALSASGTMSSRLSP